MYHLKKCRSNPVSFMALIVAISVPGIFAAGAEQRQTTEKLQHLRESGCCRIRPLMIVTRHEGKF